MLDTRTAVRRLYPRTALRLLQQLKALGAKCASMRGGRNLDPLQHERRAVMEVLLHASALRRRAEVSAEPELYFDVLACAAELQQRGLSADEPRPIDTGETEGGAQTTLDVSALASEAAAQAQQPPAAAVVAAAAGVAGSKASTSEGGTDKPFSLDLSGSSGRHKPAPAIAISGVLTISRSSLAGKKATVTLGKGTEGETHGLTFAPGEVPLRITAIAAGSLATKGFLKPAVGMVLQTLKDSSPANGGFRAKAQDVSALASDATVLALIESSGRPLALNFVTPAAAAAAAAAAAVSAEEAVPFFNASPPSADAPAAAVGAAAGADDNEGDSDAQRQLKRTLCDSQRTGLAGHVKECAKRNVSLLLLDWPRQQPRPDDGGVPWLQRDMLALKLGAVRADVRHSVAWSQQALAVARSAESAPAAARALLDEDALVVLALGAFTERQALPPPPHLRTAWPAP